MRSVSYFEWFVYEADRLNWISISGHAALGSTRYGHLDNYAYIVYVHVDRKDTCTNI